MFFWWIFGGKSGLPILFLCHLRTTSCLCNFKFYIVQIIYLASLKIFSLYIFSAVWISYAYIDMIDLCIYLMISKLPVSQVWFLLLNLANSKPCYLKYFVYFFSFWYSYYAYVTLFKIVQPFLDILFSYLLCFAFSLECFYWHNFRLTHFFLHYFQTRFSFQGILYFFHSVFLFSILYSCLYCLSFLACYPLFTLESLEY